MEIFIDEKRIEEAGFPSGTVEEMLRHAQQHYCAPGRLVVRIRCDHQDVSGDQMTSVLQRETARCDRLEIFTDTKGSLIHDAMTEAAHALEQSELQCRRAAELIHEGNSVGGIEALGECMRVWQQIHAAVVQSIQMLGLDVHDAVINETPVAELITRPRNVLLQIRDALAARDHVLLADVLQYELADVTEQWFTVISYLQERAQAQPDHEP